MRKLTILRKKTFVGCAATMKVYIEDPWNPELTIAGVGCKKLGELKNGESATYEVSDASVRVFVIADKLSRDLCNDFYTLPAGTEDISLSGKCHMNPAVGNAFRFEGNESNEAAVDNRKKTLHKALIIFAIVAVVSFTVGLIGGCAGQIIKNLSNYEAGEEKTFTYREMSIQLDDTFEVQETGADGYEFNVHWKSEDAIVGVLREPSTSVMSASITREEYAQLVLRANNLEDKEIQYDGAMPYVVFKSGMTTNYLFFFKGNNVFWTVQVIVPTFRAKAMEEYVMEWGKSVRV